MTPITVKEYAEDNNTAPANIMQVLFKQRTPVTLNQELTIDQVAFLNTKKPWPAKSMRKPVAQAAYSSRTADKFVVRLTDGLRERIHKLSNEKHRSMNSQIVHYLEMCVELDENSESGLNKEALMAMFETCDTEPSLIVPYQAQLYTPAPGCPVRVKNGGVWVLRNYVARDDEVKAILECFMGEKSGLLDVSIDQLEPV